MEKVVDLMEAGNDLERGLKALAERHAGECLLVLKVKRSWFRTGRGIVRHDYDCIGTAFLQALSLLSEQSLERCAALGCENVSNSPSLSIGVVEAWRHAWGVFSHAMKLPDDDETGSVHARQGVVESSC